MAAPEIEQLVARYKALREYVEQQTNQGQPLNDEERRRLVLQFAESLRKPIVATPRVRQ